MADKEFKIKVTVDTGEGDQKIEKTISTLQGFETQLSKLQTKLSGSKIGSKEFNELEKEISRTEKAMVKAKSSNETWLQSVSKAPGLVGTLGQSLQGVGKLFGNLDMAFKTSVIGFFATIIAKLIEKFSQMEGVMDPLNKIFSLWSQTLGVLANAILPPIAATLEFIAEGAVKLTNAFGKLMGGGDDLGNVLGELEDQQDSLSDSQADFELQQSKSNRALAEAREIAGDSTRSIKDRKKAVQEAADLEKKIAKENIDRATQQARIIAGQIAAATGMSTQRIKEIQKYDAVQLESFTKEIAQRKGLNQEQRTALLQQIQLIQQTATDSSKIQTKANKQLAGLSAEDVADKKEAAAKRKEIADKALEQQKNRVNAQIEIEKNKANTDEKTLRAYLEKKDELENKGTKKSQEELDLQKQNREKAIQDALKADKDAIKAKNDEVAKGEDDKIKILKQAGTNEVAGQEIILEQKKIKYGEDSQEYKDQQEILQITREKNIKDEIDAIGKKTIISEADRQRLIELGNEQVKLTNVVDASNKTQVESTKKKLEEETALKYANDMAALEYEYTKAETTAERQREILKEEERLLTEKKEKDLLNEKLTAEQKVAIQQKYTKDVGDLTKKRIDIEQKEFDNKIKLAQGVAGIANALSDIIGRETVEGKALAVAASLINTYSAIAAQLKTAAGSPGAAIPGYAIAQAVITGLVGFKAVADIMAVQVPQNDVPEVRIRKALGGVLQGPSHAMGGITTPFGELEGGEYVVNKTATQLFRPSLDKINSLGGNIDYQEGGFLGTGGTNSTPIIKTYVVASEMSSQQELDRVIKDRSKI